MSVPVSKFWHIFLIFSGSPVQTIVCFKPDSSFFNRILLLKNLLTSYLKTFEIFWRGEGQLKNHHVSIIETNQFHYCSEQCYYHIICNLIIVMDVENVFLSLANKWTWTMTTPLCLPLSLFHCNFTVNLTHVQGKFMNGWQSDHKNCRSTTSLHVNMSNSKSWQGKGWLQ